MHLQKLSVSVPNEQKGQTIATFRGAKLDDISYVTSDLHTTHLRIPIRQHVFKAGKLLQGLLNESVGYAQQHPNQEGAFAI